MCVVQSLLGRVLTADARWLMTCTASGGRMQGNSVVTPPQKREGGGVLGEDGLHICRRLGMIC